MYLMSPRIFSPDKPTSYLMYFDANNLYGWAMSESQPYRNFKWVKEYEFKSILDILTPAHTSSALLL